MGEEISEQSKTVGILMKKARLNAGLDVETCARTLGIPQEQLEAYEAGRMDPNLPQLEILSRLYGVPITYFWSERVASEGWQAPLPVSTILAVRRRMIGVLLRQARLAAGKSLSECAELLGTTSETMAAYEYGREDIPFRSLTILAEFLHVPLAYFADEALLPNSEKERQALEMLAQLPPEARDFVLKPANVLYVRLAMLLSTLSTDTLRRLGEGLLDITL